MILIFLFITYNSVGAAKENEPMLCTAKCSANMKCVFKDESGCYNPPCSQIPTCVPLQPGEVLGPCGVSSCSLNAQCLIRNGRQTCVVPDGTPSQSCSPPCKRGKSCYIGPIPPCLPDVFCPIPTPLCVNTEDQNSSPVCNPPCKPGFECAQAIVDCIPEVPCPQPPPTCISSNPNPSGSSPGYIPIMTTTLPIITTGPLPVCCKNERINQCGALCEAKCSDLTSGPIACPLICLPPACVCAKGYYRNDKGKCVSKEDCSTDLPITTTTITPPLSCKGPDERLNVCGKFCEPQCNDLITGPRFCPDVCIGPPACVCSPGLYRDVHGQCIPKSLCPPVLITTTTTTTPPPLVCGPSERINPCGNFCEAQCEDILNGPRFCPDVCIGHPTCVCIEGLYRHKGQCVTSPQCPPINTKNQKPTSTGCKKTYPPPPYLR